MSLPDPYKVLQVDPEAEEEVIEAAYRRLARKYHPDVAVGPDAQDRMVGINQAWEMLRDPTRRAAVDRARARTATTAARVADADAHRDLRAAHRAPEAPPVRGAAAAAFGADAGRTPGRADSVSGGPGRPFPGMAPKDLVSPDWTAGRSATGGGYDARTMSFAQGEGAAGPPPGNPSGSVLNFGRYTGWSLGEIARSDLEYLEWLDRMPIGRTYQFEIDALLRSKGRRATASTAENARRGLFRRR
jgi:curved DNA-binding protein CbpA